MHTLGDEDVSAAAFIVEFLTRFFVATDSLRRNFKLSIAVTDWVSIARYGLFGLSPKVQWRNEFSSFKKKSGWYLTGQSEGMRAP